MATVGGTISTEDLLLARSKGRGLKLCVQLGILLSALALLPAATSTQALWRRIAAVALVLACWLAAERFRKRRSWVPDVLADRRWVLAAAALTALPYAIDGHAQSTAYMGIAPLAGVAAVACRRREVVFFAAISMAAYVVGVAVGGWGTKVLLDAKHPFDAAQQVVAIGACCGLFAFAVLGLRRFIEQIPELVAPDEEGVPDEEPVPPSEQLTDRERQVLECLRNGFRRGEIATELYITRETVNTHLANIEAKLGVSSQEEAVAVFYRDYYNRA